VKKYRFPDRASAEKEIARLEQTITLHQIALDCLLREEITWTERFYDGETWFQMGLARVDKAHGGLVFVREFYPVNGKPSQDVHWADGWIAGKTNYFAEYSPVAEDVYIALSRANSAAGVDTF
jgi:hypothetical protein